MAFRFSLECQGQTVGSDCHTHWSEKDRKPCPRSRGKSGDPSVMSHTGAGMRRDGADSLNTDPGLGQKPSSGCVLFYQNPTLTILGIKGLRNSKELRGQK